MRREEGNIRGEKRLIEEERRDIERRPAVNTRGEKRLIKKRREDTRSASDCTWVALTAGLELGVGWIHRQSHMEVPPDARNEEIVNTSVHGSTARFTPFLLQRTQQRLQFLVRIQSCVRKRL